MERYNSATYVHVPAAPSATGGRKCRQPRSTVAMVFHHVVIQRVSVVEFLPVDVTFKSLDAGVLCEMCFQVVDRPKPSTAELSIICIHSLVHIHVHFQRCHTRVISAIVVTVMHDIACVSSYTVCAPVNTSCRVCQHCLEHKHSSVRCSLHMA